MKDEKIRLATNELIDKLISYKKFNSSMIIYEIKHFKLKSILHNLKVKKDLNIEIKKLKEISKKNEYDYADMMFITNTESTYWEELKFIELSNELDIEILREAIYGEPITIKSLNTILEEDK